MSERRGEQKAIEPEPVVRRTPIVRWRGGAAAMLVDGKGREIRYLRLSVTAHCNLRCRYCRPRNDRDAGNLEPCLSDEEILRLCHLLATKGIEKIRITGGEPLLRPGLPRLIRFLSEIPGIIEVSLTTNGLLLKNYVADLAAAGLRRLNVSLDSLQEDRFAEITRGGSLAPVLEGISAAERHGFSPIKINVVVMRGVNDDEAADFARLTMHRDLEVRFIELMPSGPAASSWSELFVETIETRRRIESVGRLIPTPDDFGSRYPRFSFPGAVGKIAFISPITDPFCAFCDRLRITASGELRPCLRFDWSINIGHLLRRGSSDNVLLSVIRRAVRAKDFRFPSHAASAVGQAMSSIGG